MTLSSVRLIHAPWKKGRAPSATMNPPLPPSLCNVAVKTYMRLRVFSLYPVYDIVIHKTLTFHNGNLCPA